MKNKPYHVPGNIPLLIFNLNKKGLDNPKVRQAIAYAIDYANIATTAMSDYSVPANASLIIPTGYEAKFYDAAAVEADGWKYDQDKAIDILEDDLKAKKGSDGIYVLPDGTKLGGWKLITPDRLDRLEHRLRDRGQVGQGDRHRHHHRVPAVPDSGTQRCRTATSTWPCTPTPASTRPARGSGSATPWTTGACRPSASRPFWNYNRFKNAEVAALLDAAAGAKSDAEAKTAYAALDKIYRENDPGRPADVPPAGVLRVQREQLDELPDRGEPVRSADVAGRRDPVAVQDQEGRQLSPIDLIP